MRTNHYIEQFKFGLILLAIASLIALATFLFSCGKSYTPEYEVAENTKYDAPAKSEITRRLILKDSITKENVQRLLDKEFEWSLRTSMEHHNPASHIFIYVYAPGADWKGKDGDKWLGMVSRVNNEDNGIKINDSLN
jgi:hypothetical protein